MSERLRWRIALLISGAIAISYFDRQTVSVAITAIQRQIPISNTQFSELQACFLIAYALMYVGGGMLIDFLGTRAGFTLIMLWWSLACASHGLAQGFAMLAVSRVLLGLGEGGGFPAATKAVAEWFPTRERSTAMGIMNAGSAVGAVVAPPLIALVILHLNWRWVFFLSGTIGLIWTFFWWRRYQPARLHGGLAGTEREEIREVLDAPPQKEKLSGGEWVQLLGFREVWGLVTAKFLSDSAWYFYLFWLPKYLYDARGLDIKSVGYFAWIPYAFSGVGSLCGGWFSSKLIRSGHSLDFSRKMALGASAAVMPVILFMTKAPVELAIVLFSIAFFGQQSWSTLVMIVPADLFPRRAVGSVAGMVGFGGAIGGAVFGMVVGYILDHGFGYGPVFLAVGTFHIIAFLIILLSVRKVAPLRLEKSVVGATL
ncbi:MAG TPA: MFS transporter [Bryobacteraceae bacterium]|nr:MFS transporter [Bryobacteraceae bacterium]